MKAPFCTALRVPELNDISRSCSIGGRALITEDISALAQEIASRCDEAEWTPKTWEWVTGIDP